MVKVSLSTLNKCYLTVDYPDSHVKFLREEVESMEYYDIRFFVFIMRKHLHSYGNGDVLGDWYDALKAHTDFIIASVKIDAEDYIETLYISID